jgi:hypothetical protein
VQAAIALGATPLAIDEVGVPRLLRGSGGPALPATSPSTSAMLHVARIAPAWGVRGGAVPQLVPAMSRCPAAPCRGCAS